VSHGHLTLKDFPAGGGNFGGRRRISAAGGARCGNMSHPAAPAGAVPSMIIGPITSVLAAGAIAYSIGPHTLRGALQTALIDAKILRLTWYEATRHTFASHWGMDLT
jgi:hypothetical protein